MIYEGCLISDKVINKRDDMNNIKKEIKSCQLKSTNGDEIDLSRLQGINVVYVFPRASSPLQLAIEKWDSTPGTKGCTIQSRVYSQTYNELKSAGMTELYGLSTQETDIQKEIVNRLKLPFPFLSDNYLHFSNSQFCL